MGKKLCLLRGINVGGKNIIKMTDLKQSLQGIGLEKVETYIQSGNVIFYIAGKEDNSILENIIEKAISENYGFEVPVIVRTVDELNEALKQSVQSLCTVSDIRCPP